MDIRFRVASANKCSKADVVAALSIYCRSVDSGSFTDTNQIKDYIWNPKSHKHESRQMFFFILYGNEDEVEGFSEFAYLPENQILVLDYLCTSKRSSVQFYNFYHLVLQEIEAELKQQQLFIRFIMTELSLSKRNGELADNDSNYFRHLLSNENYQLIKYPYYQPPLLKTDTLQAFNIAMKPVSLDIDSALVLTRANYLSIIHELYFSHYLAWYENFRDKDDLSVLIDGLYKRIQSETPTEVQSESIVLVQCQLYDAGQCPRLPLENYTISMTKKKKRRKTISICFWITLTVLTFLLCIIPTLTAYAAIMSSFLTIVAGIISIYSFRRDIFDR